MSQRSTNTRDADQVHAIAALRIALRRRTQQERQRTPLLAGLLRRRGERGEKKQHSESCVTVNKINKINKTIRPAKQFVG